MRKLIVRFFIFQFFIIQKDFFLSADLKNEMYSRLLALAGTFQIEISNAISIPVHRLLRENVFMKNELMQIVNETLSRNEVCMSLR